MRRRLLPGRRGARRIAVAAALAGSLPAGASEPVRALDPPEIGGMIDTYGRSAWERAVRMREDAGRLVLRVGESGLLDELERAPPALVPELFDAFEEGPGGGEEDVHPPRPDG